MENYPMQLDEIDQWLFDNIGVLPGCCSSIEELKYHTAREVAEKLWMKDTCNQCELNQDTVFWKGINQAIKDMENGSIETTIVNDWTYGQDPDHAIIPAVHLRIGDKYKVGEKVKLFIFRDNNETLQVDGHRSRR